MVMDADPRRIRRVHIEPSTNPLRRRRRLAVAADGGDALTADSDPMGVPDSGDD